MNNSKFKIITNKYPVGRCVHCEASDYCLSSKFICNCSYGQLYINIKTERKLKLEKLYESR